MTAMAISSKMAVTRNSLSVVVCGMFIRTIGEIMMNREEALLAAATACEEYAFSLMIEKPDWAEVALECSRIIDDIRKRALTIAEIGDGSCQELSSFLVVPEIDYTSGLPR